MKHLFTAILIMAAFSVKAQTIDTAIVNCTAAKINQYIIPEFPSANDTITHLGVFQCTQTDTSCSVNYTFIVYPPLRNVKPDWYQMTNAEFLAWDKTLKGCLPIIASHFSLTFK